MQKLFSERRRYMKSKTKQILAAIIFMIVLWILGSVCSGEMILADSLTINVITESARDVLSSVYPYFFVCAVIAAIVTSAMNRKKAFAITTAVMTAIPFVSLGMEFIISRIFPDGSIWLLPFMFPASPAATLINMLM